MELLEENWTAAANSNTSRVTLFLNSKLAETSSGESPGSSVQDTVAREFTDISEELLLAATGVLRIIALNGANSERQTLTKCVLGSQSICALSSGERVLTRKTHEIYGVKEQSASSPCETSRRTVFIMAFSDRLL